MDKDKTRPDKKGVSPSVIAPLSVRVKATAAILLLAAGAIGAAVFPATRETSSNTSYLLTHLNHGPFSYLELDTLEPEPSLAVAEKEGIIRSGTGYEPEYHGETTADTMVLADISERVTQQYSLTDSSLNMVSRPVGVTTRKGTATSLTTAEYPAELPGLLAKEMETTRRKFQPVESVELERNSTVFSELPFSESAMLTESNTASDSLKSDTAKVAAEKETAMKLADDDRYGKLVPIRQWNGAPIVDSSDLVPVQLFSSLNTEPLVPIGNK